MIQLYTVMPIRFSDSIITMMRYITDMIMFLNSNNIWNLYGTSINIAPNGTMVSCMVLDTIPTADSATLTNTFYSFEAGWRNASGDFHA
jgi:hypothetical protein